MDAEMKEVFAKAIALNEELNEKGKELKLLKEKIKSWHKTMGRSLVVEDGIYSNVSSGTRSTLSPELIEKVLKVTVTPECYSTSNYDILKFRNATEKDMKKLIVEKCDESKLPF